jgi:hypothetical protein
LTSSGPRSNGTPKCAAQRVEIAAAASRHDHPLRGKRGRHAPADHVGRHQRRDLQADFTDFPRERRRRHAFEHRMQTVFGKPASQEDDVVHASPSVDSR